jgi:hypothetical protein
MKLPRRNFLHLAAVVDGRAADYYVGTNITGGPRVDRLLPEPPLATRRRFLATAAAGVSLAPLAALAQAVTELPLPGGPGERPITTRFPQKGALILQRTRPPLLETPFEVFDRSVFTPNDQFFVRW